MIEDIIAKYMMDEDSEEARDYRKMRQDQMDAEHHKATPGKRRIPKKRLFHSSEIKEKDPHDYR